MCFYFLGAYQKKRIVSYKRPLSFDSLPRVRGRGNPFAPRNGKHSRCLVSWHVHDSKLKCGCSKKPAFFLLCAPRWRTSSLHPSVVSHPVMHTKSTHELQHEAVGVFQLFFHTCPWARQDVHDKESEQEILQISPRAEKLRASMATLWWYGGGEDVWRNYIHHDSWNSQLVVKWRAEMWWMATAIDHWNLFTAGVKEIRGL